jgi:hypothetical protein
MSDETIKDFDLTSGLEDPPAAEFKAGGRTWHIRASIPVVPFATAWSTGPDGQQRIQIENVVRMCIVPDETDEFLALLNDPVRSPVTNRNMEEFFNFLMEKAGKVQPAASSSSSNGSSTNGRTSAARSSSAAGRRRPSPRSR